MVEWSVKLVDFGSKLKELRTQAGMTQQQLATLVGVTKSVISFYELRERAPSPDVLIKCAGIFHVSTDYLLGLDKSDTLDISGLSESDIAILRALVESLRQKGADKK
jgi:transcriptional regulator with XRE-family HTH domain